MRLIGLTSLSHFGFITLGIFVFSSQGGTGSILYMVNHGLGTAALFLVAGYVVSRRGTASIREMGGAEKVTPVLAGLFLVAGLAALGLPGLSTFVSEMLVIIAAFDYAWYVGAVAVTGIVLAAIYVLWMYQRTMTGPTPAVEPVAAGVRTSRDLSTRELVAVAPLFVGLVLFGFYPMPLMEAADPYVGDLLSQVGVTDDPPEVGADAHSDAGSDSDTAEEGEN